jgi:hypothetical protein
MSFGVDTLLTLIADVFAIVGVWTQLPDAALTNTETANWASYRQALRNITTQSDPFNIIWPTAPVKARHR